MNIMFGNASKVLARHMLLEFSTAHLLGHSTRNQVGLVRCKLRATCFLRHYCNNPPKKVLKFDERTQLHLSIVNDPNLTPRQKHVMVTALMAKVKFVDDELGRLIYADPHGKDLLQFIKTRKRLPMIGIPTAFVLAYFIPGANVLMKGFVALVLSVICSLDFYRVMQGMSKRIFFIYYEPQHQMYTALTLSGINEFGSIHFKEGDFQPDVLVGYNKVLLHGNNFFVFRGKDAYINDSFFEKLWKVKVEDEEKYKKHFEKEQNIKT